MGRVTMIALLVLVAAACGDDDAGSSTTSGGGAMLFGDEALAELANRCEDGDYGACDVLYQASDIGSEYEAFADSCGGRGAIEEAFCVEHYGIDISLSDLRTDCGAGDMLACDMLYIYSPFDSDDEEFGDSCAGRGDPGLSCAVEYGLAA